MSVKTMIDNGVLDALSKSGYLDANSYLMARIDRFSSFVPFKIPDDLSEDRIDANLDTRGRMVCKYVIHARKRINDLVYIEKNFNSRFSPEKKFKLLLFKEKLSQNNYI